MYLIELMMIILSNHLNEIMPKSKQRLNFGEKCIIVLEHLCVEANIVV
jgi:hypothetical protein